MLKFKQDDQDLRQEFYNLDPRLQIVAFSIAGFCQFHFHKSFIVTSVYRQNSGVHKDWRGLDGRTSNLSEKQSDMLINFINTHIDYGREPYMVIKDERKAGSSPNWTAPHIHVQVPPRDEVRIR